MVIRIIRVNSEYSISEIREKGSMKSYKHFIADCYDFDISRDIIASILKDVGNPQMFGILIQIRNEEYDDKEKSLYAGDKVAVAFINVSKIRSRRCTNEKIVKELVLHEFDKIRTTYNLQGDEANNILNKATLAFTSYDELYEKLKWMDLDVDVCLRFARLPDVIFGSYAHQKLYERTVQNPYPYTFDNDILSKEPSIEDKINLGGE